MSKKNSYRIPEGYFQQMQEEVKKQASIGKQESFTVPEGYFEVMQQSVLSKTAPKARVFSLRAIASVAASVAVLFIVGYTMWPVIILEMKNIIFILLLLPSLTFAQNEDIREDRREQKREKLEAQKIAYLTTELDLSTEEAQKFWPLYNEFQKAREEHRKKLTEGKDRKPNFDTMTEAEANEHLANMLVKESAELDLRRTYIEKFKTAISPQKVLKLYHSERRFRSKVVDKLRRKMKKKGKRKG